MAGYGIGGQPPPAAVIRAALAPKTAAAKPGTLTGAKLRATVGRVGIPDRPPGSPPLKPPHAAYDPFAPLTPQQIQAQIRQTTSRYGQAQTPAQIQASAQGMLDPIIAAITANVGKQTSAASENIRGNAQSLAGELGKIDYGAPYRGGEQQQAAVDAALQQSLGKAGGTDLAQGLESRLGQIGGGSVQDAASGLASRGAAIGTNQLAVGSGALSALIANEASAKNYGQQLPGIAGRQGMQDIAGVEQAGVKSVGDQTAQVMQQLPQIVEHLRDQAMSLTGTKAAAAAQLYETLTGQNITKAVSKAGLQNDQATYGLNVAKVQQGAAYDARRAAIAQQNADAGTSRANTAAYRATHPTVKAPAGTKPSSSITHAINDGYLYNADGTRALRNGAPVAVPKSNTAAAGGPTASQSKQTAEAYGAARHYHQPWTDSKGKTQPPLRWSAWLTAGLSKGISLPTLMKQGRRVYTPGEIKNDSQPGYKPGG